MSASAQSVGSYTRDQIRGFIATDPQIVIVSESTLSSGSPSYILDYAGVRVGMFLSCPNSNYQRCTAANLLIKMAPSMSRSLTSANALNGTVDYGRFYVSNDGDLWFANGLLMTGLNGDGVRGNIRIMAGIAAVLASRSSSVSYEGGETSPGENRIDVSHQPSSPLVLSEQFGLAAAEFGEALTFSEAAIADAQAFGELRKVANDFLGD